MNHERGKEEKKSYHEKHGKLGRTEKIDRIVEALIKQVHWMKIALKDGSRRYRGAERAKVA